MTESIKSIISLQMSFSDHHWLPGVKKNGLPC